VSIRLRKETGCLEVTISKNGAIDKNWSEIEKKYWTVVAV
jgi:hypothetical protein